MKFDPDKHHRRSIRLQGYDYSQPGGYFVTFVTQEHAALFGTIRNEEMILNAAGEMVVKWWQELSNKFTSVSLGTFVVMPNHFHGIILIEETVGTDLRVCPDDTNSKQGEHTGSPLPTHQNTSLSQIIQWFKTMTTNEYIRGVKQFGGNHSMINYGNAITTNTSPVIKMIGIASISTLKPTLPIGWMTKKILPIPDKNTLSLYNRGRPKLNTDY